MTWLTPRAGTIRLIQCSDLLLETILTSSYTRPCLKTFFAPFLHSNPPRSQGLQGWFIRAVLEKDCSFIVSWSLI